MRVGNNVIEVQKETNLVDMVETRAVVKIALKCNISLRTRKISGHQIQFHLDLPPSFFNVPYISFL